MSTKKTELPVTTEHFDLTFRFRHSDAPTVLHATLTTVVDAGKKLHPEFVDGLDGLVNSIREGHEKLQDKLDDPGILSGIRLNMGRPDAKRKKSYVTIKVVDSCGPLVTWLEFDVEVRRQVNEEQLRRIAFRCFRSARRRLRNMTHYEENCDHKALAFCRRTADIDMEAVDAEVAKLAESLPEVDETTFEALNRHPEMRLREEPQGLLEPYMGAHAA